MQTFTYHLPASLDEAVALMQGDPEQSRYLAGGTDLYLALEHRPEPVRHVIDLKRIPGLDGVGATPEGGWRIGGLTRMADIEHHGELNRRLPALCAAAAVVGGPPIRNRATLGGNLCNASPAADSVCPLYVLNAVCVVAGPGGTREVPVREFITGPGRTVLQQGELLVELRVPPPAANSADAYLRFIPRNEMDIAVASAGALVAFGEDGRTCTGAKVAIGAVGPRPILVPEAARALVGTTVDEAALQAAAQASSAAAQPITDIRGTEEYRRHMAGVLTRRAVTMALTRAKESKQ